MNIIQSIASVLLLLFVTMFATPVMAQEDGEKAGIHYIMFKMDEELMSDISISVNDRSFLNGYSESPVFPMSLVDSVKDYLEYVAEEVLGVPTECVYKVNNKGKEVTSHGMNGELEGMPVALLKAARNRHTDLDYFVRIDVNITGRGGKWTINPKDVRFKLKPTVTLKITQFDSEGKVMFSEKLKVKEFGKLRTREVTSGDGRVTVRKSEILYPEDIYEMLLVVGGQYIETYKR